MSEQLSRIIFAVIFVSNLVLAVWNYLKGDFIELLISSSIAILIAVWFVVGLTKKKEK